MKIAIISDIHANMQALETVLADIKSENCDKILCLGDYVMAGPQPKETLKYVMENSKDWEMIKGNTDVMVSNVDLYADKVKSVFPIMGEALVNDAKELDDEMITFLKNLPEQKELNIEGVKLLLVHGSPRKIDENIFPELPIEDVEEMIKGVDADVIFCGHTHIPCGYQTNTKKTVVNVGSVGRPFTAQPQACYVVATLKSGEIELKHKFLDYDNKLASQILAKRNFDGAEKLANILINPEVRHM